MRYVLKLSLRQLCHVAAAVTPWLPEEATPSRARLPELKLLYILLTGLLFALSTPTVAAPAPDYDASVVEITVTYQDRDPQIPWRKKAFSVRRGYGVFIGSGQVLTTEDLVRNQTDVELRRARSGVKMTATVLEADDQLNTALLTFSNTPTVEATVPLALADTVGRGDRLTIVKLEKTGEFQTSEGQVVELSSSISPRPLALRVLTQSNIEGNGTPALIGGRLAGLSVAYDGKTQTGLFIPCTTLRRFIADANAPPYKGLAWAGFQFEPLLDPVKRRYLGVDKTDGGILVTRITRGSGAAEVLQLGDVITALDGTPIDSQGYYSDPEFGRLRLAYLIGGHRSPGDRIPVALIRDRKPRGEQVLLARQRDDSEFIPEGVGGEPAEYLVEGGLVLRELTGEYLRSAGENWKLSMNPRLVYYYYHQDKFAHRPGDHVILLSMVLPDAINIGYQEFHDQVVAAVNDRPVHNMADVFQAVDDEGGLRRVSLLGCGMDLVLDETALTEANRRIAEQYRIPTLRYQKER